MSCLVWLLGLVFSIRITAPEAAYCKNYVGCNDTLGCGAGGHRVRQNVLPAHGLSVLTRPPGSTCRAWQHVGYVDVVYTTVSVL